MADTKKKKNVSVYCLILTEAMLFANLSMKKIMPGIYLALHFEHSTHLTLALAI